MTREIECRTCHKKFTTNHKGIIYNCSKECIKLERKIYDREYNRKKRIKTGDDEVGSFFGNVKEPLMPNPNGFGYLGVITYNKNRDKIQCHICGKFFRALGTNAHLKLHGITNEEYKEKFEIARTIGLVSEGTRNKMIDGVVGRGEEHLERVKEILKKNSSNEQRRKTNLGKKRRISVRNKYGSCPLQLLEHIKKLQKKLGRVPNGEDFRREHKGKYFSTILLIYGSYNEALKIAGFEPRDRVEYKYTEDQLIEFMRNFYKEHGKSPTNSDFNRGYLPSMKMYTQRFGSLNRARAFADVPLVIQTRGWRWEQIPLTPELKESLINKYR